MGRARPWLLVGSVILIALFVGLVLSWHPPKEGAPGWYTRGFASVEHERHLVIASAGEASSPISFHNPLPNVTHAHASIDLRIEDARGAGTLSAWVEFEATNGSTASTIKKKVFECDDPTSIGLVPGCSATDLDVFLSLTGWRFRPMPTPQRMADDANASSLEPPPDTTRVGQWNATLRFERSGDASFSEAEADIRLKLYTYHLRRG